MATWTQEVLDLARVIGGDRARLREEFGRPTLTVPSGWWRSSIVALRDRAHLTYFDWLSAVDEAGAPSPDPADASLAGGMRVVCHLAGLSPGVARTHLRHLVVETWIPRDALVVDSLATVYAGAAWHERETHEMFGIGFDSAGPLEALLLPDAFEGHPLRKEFVLASRVVKPWPGAKEPGESDADVASPSRRRTRPPGVPEPEQWGPRERGSDAPDPLAHATTPSGPARPRRARRAVPPKEPPGDGGTDG
ncbi:NADH-quinone oxidoreductase subunit C [Mumia flava]|uniref:NADH-quinone oxidoreductase subunit C n=1 Tax=Mumia flava TaxID=1348852 RepID=A0A0B2BMG5_9ACTN|nr:NADH-quinone oxidoreductase subunit C [Mumia flava]PJJ58268.1 NADH-quinone oxidoreductase subunit C [Mumia flava]